ncbi:MAG: glycosyltransferase [Capnocytophaga sp.]|nr:glycosyltransferase [Capnocytophaga sp.]
MKICVISFDFWGYDAHIVDILKKRGIEATHIKVVSVSYKNFGEKVTNFFSKTFLQKNLKHQKRQNYVIEQLRQLGHQDQILVLNPNTFDNSTLSYIKKCTDRLITFLYDNLERCPVQDKLYFFDKIFSFDDKDIENYGFERLTNYIYLPFLPKEQQKTEVDVFYITSYDKKRIKQLHLLCDKFLEINLKVSLFVIGKKGWKQQLVRRLFENKIFFSQKRIPHENLPEYYKKTKVILDLMRKNQYGLSFRVFEAMALEKKIITDNEKIKNYDFYNPNNILVLDKNFGNINKDFFDTPYQSLPKEIYEKYTLENWVERVFNLNN